MAKTIRELSSRVRQVGDPLAKARTILEAAHDSARAFLDVFDAVRKARAPGASTTTDEEQDILRSMLVFSAAGLDACLKQVIKDALPQLISCEPKAHQGLETYLARQLRKPVEEPDGEGSFKLLGRLLAAPSPRDQAVAEYVAWLTASSLQSPEELMRSVYALGLEPASLQIEPSKLRPIFDARNRIIHELDIDFEAPRRKRRSRARGNMIDDTNTLLAVSEAVLLAADARVHQRRS